MEIQVFTVLSGGGGGAIRHCKILIVYFQNDDLPTFGRKGTKNIIT